MGESLRAIGFDLDGTLFDDRQYVRAGFRSAAAALEAEVGENLYDAFVAAYFDRGVRERTFNVVLAEHGYPLDLVPRLIEAYHDCSPTLDPFTGAEQTLRRLQGEYRLGLLTGGTNGARKLQWLGLEEYFDAVVVAPEIDATKTDRKPFRRLLAQLGTAPSETVFVGDRPAFDTAVPNQLGMATVVVDSSHWPTSTHTDVAPDATIEHVSALPEILGTL